MTTLLLVLALSLLIGVSLGLLGGGGSILTVPILVYVAGLPAKEAIAASLFVVGVTSLAGVVSHARGGRVQWRTGVLFGLDRGFHGTDRSGTDRKSNDGGSDGPGAACLRPPPADQRRSSSSSSTSENQ